MARSMPVFVLVWMLFAALLFGLRSLQRHYALDPEWARKLLHLSMGLIALGTPWVFVENAPVIFLSALFVVFLTARHYSPRIRRLCGPVLDGVHRASIGEICFPAGVALSFLLARGDPLLFCLPVLMLTFPDAAAALVGKRWGAIFYPSIGGAKSLEGSLAFVACAVPASYAPLWLFARTGQTEALLIALNLAILLALVEALSPRGLDNLLLPLATSILLRAYLSLNLIQLSFHSCLALLSFLLFVVTALHAPRAAAPSPGGLR